MDWLDHLIDKLYDLMYGPVKGPKPQIEHDQQIYRYNRTTQINRNRAKRINEQAEELERRNMIDENTRWL